MHTIACFKKFFLCLFLIAQSTSFALTTHLVSISDTAKELLISIPIQENDYLLSDYLTITSDNPALTIGSWKSDSEISLYYDPYLQQDKRAFTNEAIISVMLEADDFNSIDNANLIVSYYLTSANQITQEIIPLEFNATNVQTTSLETQIDIPTHIETEETNIQEIPAIESPATPLVEELQATAKQDTSWFGWISQTLEQSKSLPLRLALVFLLGLLMSLTPCIYPMIPITAGILQTQSSKSFLVNFMLALSYTIGMATTFAILGLLAAFAGQAMGQFMNQPLFILPLVALLFYLALSMIGLYNMYIPRFLQPKDHTVTGGSFISVFLFGAMSGIIASPCLSPGLVCLLCIVTTLASKLLGFILLFVFGIGLSVPLLIIGTFSSSLSLLPSAGMWMVEIKKLFGFIMVGMCLYFLHYITPWHIMSWILFISALIIGLIFMYMGTHAYTKIWKLIYNSLGILLVALSVFLLFKSVQPYLFTTHSKQHNEWQTNYQHALQNAQNQNKKLFVDIGAPFCSICKAIDKSLFSDKTVREFLESNTIPVKIDGSDTANKDLITHYKVFGFPTILLIDSTTMDVIKKWGPELYSVSPQEFIKEIQQSL